MGGQCRNTCGKRRGRQAHRASKRQRAVSRECGDHLGSSRQFVRSYVGRKLDGDCYHGKCLHEAKACRSPCRGIALEWVGYKIRRRRRIAATFPATKNGFRGSEIQLTASVSSQYVSSILLGAPYASKPVTIHSVFYRGCAAKLQHCVAAWRHRQHMPSLKIIPGF